MPRWQSVSCTTLHSRTELKLVARPSQSSVEKMDDAAQNFGKQTLNLRCVVLNRDRSGKPIRRTSSLLSWVACAKTLRVTGSPFHAFSKRSRPAGTCNLKPLGTKLPWADPGLGAFQISKPKILSRYRSYQAALFFFRNSIFKPWKIVSYCVEQLPINSVPSSQVHLQRYSQGYLHSLRRH
jgi:hypothetical protein